jgi:hypothetical protein
MDIIRGILGEDKEQDEPKEKKEKPEGEKKPEVEPRPVPEKSAAREPAAQTPPGEPPKDAAIDEMADLWQTGNRDEVAQRFMDMDNETAVKLVFAIGREGALELARMVDEMLEQQEGGEGSEGGERMPGAGGVSTEPMSVEEPDEAEGEPEGAASHPPGYQPFDMQDYAKRILGM